MTAVADTSRRPLAAADILLRLNIRRERIVVPAIVVTIVGMNLATAASISSMYSTAEQKAGLAASAGTNAAFMFLLGPLDHVESTAAVVAWRAGLFMIAAAAVCVGLTVTRLTRKEEELGRVELVRAGATGELAPLASGLAVAVATSLVIGAAMALMMLPVGADGAQAVAVGAQYGTTALAAAGLAAVAAQVSATARIANVVVSSIIVGGYVLRGVGDVASEWAWLQWLTPMGWAERIDPFGVISWWPALASVAVFAAGVGGATWLSTRRDLGGGLLQPRPGPATTTRLATSSAVARRLASPGLFGWTLGIVVYAAVIGFLVPSVGELAADNPQISSYLRQLGGDGDLGSVFIATMMSFLAAGAAAWVVTAVLRVRADEGAGRAEVLLAVPLSRSRYFLDQVLVVVAGVVVIMACAAVGIAIPNALVAGDAAAAFGQAFAAAAVQIPPALVVAAGALALYGIRPSWAIGGWVVVAAAFVIGPMGSLLGLPQWARDVSPFTHVPLVPAEPLQVLPLIVMSGVAVGVAAVGWWCFRRRDVG